MPTGYTAGIYEGSDTDFNSFVWKCARAFGALIMLRDNSFDSKIPENLGYEDESYSFKRIKELEKELDILKSLSQKEITAQCIDEYNSQMESWMKRYEHNVLLKARYQEMLDNVTKWEPPTEEHRGLKRFMQDQLHESMLHDCDNWLESSPQPISPEEWFSKRVENITSQIPYHKKRYEEELKARNDRVNWVKDLNKSVPMPENLKG